MPLPAPVGAYDQFLIDLDGCVYIGDEALPGAADAVAALRADGKRVAFVTNDARRAGEDYVRKLWRLGVRASVGDVVTAGAAVQHLLAQRRDGGRAVVVGSEAMRRHVSDAGLRIVSGSDLAPRADVVVVAGTEDLVYADLRDAALAARAGAPLLGTARDPTYPTPGGLWPGTGAILAAIETASGRTAEIVGKPEPQLFLTALERLGEGRTLAVGDRLAADVAAAARIGIDSALVLSGGATAEQAEAAEGPHPTFVSPSLAALVRGEATSLP